jgi:hypothetical protein
MNNFVESHIASCALVPASGGVRGNEPGHPTLGLWHSARVGEILSLHVVRLPPALRRSCVSSSGFPREALWRGPYWVQ